MVQSPTEGEIKVCTWLREISFCSCLAVLPGPDRDLLSRICIPYFRALYMYTTIERKIMAGCEDGERFGLLPNICTCLILFVPGIPLPFLSSAVCMLAALFLIRMLRPSIHPSIYSSLFPHSHPQAQPSERAAGGIRAAPLKIW